MVSSSASQARPVQLVGSPVGRATVVTLPGPPVVFVVGSEAPATSVAVWVYTVVDDVPCFVSAPEPTAEMYTAMPVARAGRAPAVTVIPIPPLPPPGEGVTARFEATVSPSGVVYVYLTL